MYNVETLTHVETRFNSNLGVVVTTVELKLDNGDVVKEQYGFMTVKASDITGGRIYAIVEMAAGASVGKKGIFVMHPVTHTRIASGAKNARALWAAVVPELNRWLDAQELMSLRVRAVVNTLADIDVMLTQ